MKTLEKMILDRFRAVQYILQLDDEEWQRYNEAVYGVKFNTNFIHLHKCSDAVTKLKNAINFAEKCLGMIDGGKEDEHESNCR